jgi:trk system potassium uptake protein TrkH
VTACLITFGTLFFLAFEFNNPATMGKLDFFGKLNSAFFQSVTPRTAGFNSLPLNDMMEISKVLTIILMFIGAAPGSTAGGIKVTTFSIILIAIISQVKGSEETVIFKHRVPNATVMKALTIAGLSAMLVTAVTTVIMAFENLPLINVLYEVTSAFGTVGLSTGITPELRSISKLMLVMTMFLGRVGPLTFAIALSLKHNNKKADIIYPEGKIVVG